MDGAWGAVPALRRPESDPLAEPSNDQVIASAAVELAAIAEPVEESFEAMIAALANEPAEVASPAATRASTPETPPEPEEEPDPEPDAAFAIAPVPSLDIIPARLRRFRFRR